MHLKIMIASNKMPPRAVTHVIARYLFINIPPIYVYVGIPAKMNENDFGI